MTPAEQLAREFEFGYKASHTDDYVVNSIRHIQADVLSQRNNGATVVKQVEKMRTALQLVLLFYTAGQWSDDLKKDWAEKTKALLGKPNDAAEHDATTRVLCDAVRKALQ